MEKVEIYHSNETTVFVCVNKELSVKQIEEEVNKLVPIDGEWKVQYIDYFITCPESSGRKHYTLEKI